MKDIVGNLLGLGDRVVLCWPGYSSIVVGVVVKFTPTGVRVKYTTPTNGGERTDEVFRPANNVCKVMS